MGCYKVVTNRSTFSFATREEAEEYGHIHYVSGGAPNYTIEFISKGKPYHRLENGKVVSCRPVQQMVSA